MYRICKETYYNEYGNPSTEYYIIEKRKSFLGIKYWSPIKHYFYDFKKIVTLDTYEKAMELYNKLCTGGKRDTWVKQIVYNK